MRRLTARLTAQGSAALPGEEAGPLCAQPLPRVLRLVGSKVADATAFGHTGGDATQPAGLKKLYEGARPPQYQPMKKQGAIILGIGGDSSDRAVGTFYEGVMTTGYATDATDQAVHANIAAAGYG